MVIGNGDLASAIIDRPGFTFFASGVSNSSETKYSEFQREVSLLLEQDRNTRLVYFSSLAVFNNDSAYLQHKRKMETMVAYHFPSYNIVRLGNIDWGTNPHTLINYLKAHPEAEIYDEWRYIVDKDEFQYWINMIPDWNSELSIVGRRMKVVDIVKEYV